MALPRKIVNAIKAGTYIPSPASKRAREAATRLREQRSSEQPQRDTFRSVKERMVQKKHGLHYGTPGYNPVESAQAVFGSDEYEAMRNALNLSPDQMRQLASMASKAHAAQAKNGSAGELEVYLVYDFLFYHL